MDENQSLENPKHFKAFWPIVIIAVVSFIVGGLLVWAAFNAGLDEELNSLLPGANYVKTHKNIPQPINDRTNGWKDITKEELASIQSADWQTYTNEKYGFEVRLSSAWKGYKVFISHGSQGVGAPAYIQFAMPTIDKTKCVLDVTDEVCGYVAPLTITVSAKDLGVSTVDGKVAEDDTHVYYYSTYTHFNELPQDLREINFEISKIVSSFKFTK